LVTTKRLVLAVAAVFAVLAVTLFLVTWLGNNQDSATIGGSLASSAGSAPTLAPAKVLVVIEENHSYAQMKAGMPFLSGLSDRYGYATHWTAITHPSEPNYLAIAGGSTFGITDDKAPSAHYTQIGSAKSVFDQALKAGKTAKTYAESMPDNCHIWDYPDQAVAPPKYAVRHNPWVYFKTTRTACTANDLPLGTFSQDAAGNALPNVGFLIPNLCNDAHNCSLGTADGWLKQQLTPVLASKDFHSGNLVVVVTADEDDKKSGNTVLTSVLTPHLSGKVVGTPLTHYSLTRYIAQVLGVTPLMNGKTAPDMKAAFGL
jgi:phosphatidylinositol-3-phosphatase